MKLNEIMQSSWFTPDSEKDEKKPSQFLVRGLTGAEQTYMTQFSELKGDRVLIDPDGILAHLECGISDWKHVPGNNGKMIKFKKSLLSQIPDDQTMELFGRIQKLTTPGEPEIKNS